jgi:hypothetical protein
VTRFSRVAFAALVVATMAAFVVTQHLKRSPPILLHAAVRPAHISPDDNGTQDSARIGFQVKRSDEATVTVVDSAGDPVRSLGRRSAHTGVLVRLVWDGHTDAGGVAPEGRYRVRVDLRRAGRSITIPGGVSVDTHPPEVTVLRVRSLAHSRRFAVRLKGYISRAPVLLVYRVSHGGRVLVARRPGRPGGALRWEGEIRGRPAPPGIYELAIRVRDLAGNLASLPPRLPPTAGEPGLRVRVAGPGG